MLTANKCCDQTAGLVNTEIAVVIQNEEELFKRTEFSCSFSCWDANTEDKLPTSTHHLGSSGEELHHRPWAQHQNHRAPPTQHNGAPTARGFARRTAPASWTPNENAVLPAHLSSFNSCLHFVTRAYFLMENSGLYQQSRNWQDFIKWILLWSRM